MAIVALLAFATGASAAPPLVPQSFGTLGGPGGGPNGITDDGVMGTSAVASGRPHAFVTSGDSMIDLGTLGGSSSIVTAMNNNGRVVGFSQTSTGPTHAFISDGNGLVDLGTLGGTLSQALAVNDQDQVAGMSTGSGTPPHQRGAQLP